MRDHRGSPTLANRSVPIVFASYLHKNIRGAHRILTDDGAIGRMAAAHLLERGFRHFAFVGYDGSYWSRQRQESFAQALAEAGRPCAVFEQAQDLRLRAWRKERKVLTDWLRTLNRPVGLMACNDDRARQVVDACALAGLNIPGDLAVLGVDDDEFVCGLSNPPISSIALNIEDAGYQAAMLLDELMKARREPARAAVPTAVRAGPCPSAPPTARQILVSPIAVTTRRSTDSKVIEDPHVAAAVQFIRTNCRRPIQIADVLRRVPISRRSLLDRFRRTVGCTVHQYIKRVRVAQIEELLLGTTHSIGQIAEILGFPDSDHLALYFRSVKSMNPLAFRARHITSRPSQSGESEV